VFRCGTVNHLTSNAIIFSLRIAVSKASALDFALLARNLKFFSFLDEPISG